tara:strand:- start:438 stop:539 length:102 start_codon:yes stop_codon:yes gene_type:complete
VVVAVVQDQMVLPVVQVVELGKITLDVDHPLQE